jgi:hypothetical protein
LLRYRDNDVDRHRILNFLFSNKFRPDPSIKILM